MEGKRGGRQRQNGGEDGGLLQRASVRGVSPGKAKAAIAIAIAVLVIVVVRWAPSAGGAALVIESPGAEEAAGDEGGGGAGSGDAAGAGAGGTVGADAGGAAGAGAAGSSESSAAGDGAAGGKREEIFVHVVGAVANPGVYTLEEGARVADAVELAGGLAPDACDSSVNLARVVVDGEQVYVPTDAEVEAGLAPASGSSPPASSADGGAGALVNINTATSEQLQALPGIGPATATAIISHREENGPFEAKEDIQKVSGIGPGKYAKIESLICV